MSRGRESGKRAEEKSLSVIHEKSVMRKLTDKSAFFLPDGPVE